MLQFSGKWARFDAREAIAKACRKVKPGGRMVPSGRPLGALINRADQTFAHTADFGYLRQIMPDDRIASAYDRIEAALGRIERSARATASPSAQSPGADADLAARHAALRETVTATLGELDQLIERLEP